MTTFPNSPRLAKGALIGIDLFNPLASVIIFQYNPETLTRTITAQTGEAEVAQGEMLRLKGPPQETISLQVDIDATDQLEQDKGQAKNLGIHPTLAALEMLLYPKSALVIANEALLNAGIIEIIPPKNLLTVLVWGPKRILPVLLKQISIVEEAFDTHLNPIRAKVTLELRVLNYQDLGLASAGGALFLMHQVTKEVMATIGSVGNMATLLP
jgi:hypothetical protein